MTIIISHEMVINEMMIEKGTIEEKCLVNLIYFS